MNNPLLPLLLAAGTLLPLSAETPSPRDLISEAAADLQSGRPDRALDLLNQAPDTVEQAFWRGRALLALGRYREALAALAAVPPEHELYTYAAKGMIYGAQRSEELDPQALLAPLTQQNLHPEIARMACAALAEHHLLHGHPTPEDKARCTAEALQMMEKAWPDPQNRTDPAYTLLRVYLLAHQNHFTEAEELCRSIESNPSTNSDMRLRARLALAEVYYLAADAAQEQTEREEQADKAEETLLQFISANPNSPLIGEAFRRLNGRQAFKKSEYAVSKLREWAQDLLSAHRSCLAMYMLMVNPSKGNDSLTRSLTLANAALSHFPNEPAVRSMQFQHADRLIANGACEEALVYLKQVPAQDPYRLFYEAQLQQDNSEQAMRSYLDAAKLAPEGLYTPALVNALTCALRSGDQQTQDTILRAAHLEPRTKAALLLARATYLADTRPDEAKKDLEEALALPLKAMLRTQCELDLASLELNDAPDKANQRLNELERGLQACSILSPDSARHGTFPHGFLMRDSWTAEQLLRYLNLKETCIRQLHADNRDQAVKLALETTRRVRQLTQDPYITSALTLHEASLLAENRQTREARDKLEQLLEQEKSPDMRARAYLMLGNILSSMETLDSLQKSIFYFEQSAKTNTWYANLATAFHASILVRLGKIEQAQQLLSELLQKESGRLRSDVKAYIYSVLADSWALSSRVDAQDEAIRACTTILADDTLPREWRNRLLLQHATLCARYDRHQEALASYQAILDADPVSGDAPGRADWYLLYYAGAGAIASCLEAKEYAKAADIAERVGMWKTTFPEEFQVPSTRFLEWAKLIRRLHTLERENDSAGEKRPPGNSQRRVLRHLQPAFPELTPTSPN